VLFLDEPTTGLDPTSRARTWEVIRALVSDGATVLLTTQYLEEADELADQIVVVDHGRAIATGSAAELKSQVGGARLDVTLSTPSPDAARLLEPFVSGAVELADGGRHLRAPVRGGDGLATRVVRALDQAGIIVDDVEVRQPSLDDVFFALTGHPAEDDAGAEERVVGEPALEASGR
jgi:ABC-2 type transport system ATP-binding protein